jgi:hypothetical protein
MAKQTMRLEKSARGPQRVATPHNRSMRAEGGPCVQRMLRDFPLTEYHDQNRSPVPRLVPISTGLFGSQAVSSRAMHA